MFLPGSLLNLGDDSCFIPILAQKQSSQETWFLGDIFLSQYYTVFDMTPFEQGKDYIRVGVAKINPDDRIGESLIEKYRKNLTDLDSIILLIVLLLITMILISVYACLKTRQKK
jgi:ABC-type multidrug transport system permease subunit